MAQIRPSPFDECIHSSQLAFTDHSPTIAVNQSDDGYHLIDQRVRLASLYILMGRSQGAFVSSLITCYTFTFFLTSASYPIMIPIGMIAGIIGSHIGEYSMRRLLPSS